MLRENRTKMLFVLEERTLSNQNKLPNRVPLLFNTFAILHPINITTIRQFPENNLELYIHNLKDVN